MSRLRVAVDVGGTFTDICVLDEDTGAMSVAKVPSTPADPIDAVIEGVRGAAEVDLRDPLIGDSLWAFSNVNLFALSEIRYVAFPTPF